MKTKTVDAHQVSRMKEDGAVIINVLPKEYFEAGHIKGSRNICIYDSSFLKDVSTATRGPNRAIIVYAKNQNFHASELAYEKLLKAGYIQVYDFKGGIEEWQKEGFEVEGDMSFPEEKLPPGSYMADPEKCLIEWESGSFFLRHAGDFKVEVGEILVGENSHIVGGRIIFNMDSVRNNDLSEKYRGMLDNYLKSTDFLYVRKFSTAEFRVVKVDPIPNALAGTENYEVRGDLTVRDITHPIFILAQVESLEAGVIVAQARFSLSRKLWGFDYFLSLLWGFWEYKFYFRIKIFVQKNSQ